MKKALYLLLFLVVYSGVQAQKTYYSGWPKYYEFEEGVQMVEIVFGISDIQLFANYHRNMNSISTALPEPPDPNPSIYIFRDSTGKVLHTFNRFGQNLKQFKILPPDSVTKKQLQKHTVSRYTILENVTMKQMPKGSYAVDIYTHANADRSKSKQGLVDRKGNIVVKPIYDEAFISTDKNIVSAKLNKKYGILDENGKILQPFIYDEMECWSYDGGMFRLVKKNKVSYANSKGEIISKREYDSGEIFWSRRALVRLNGKYGHIDSVGNETVPLIYDNAESFYYNVAIVRLGEKYGMVNNTGEVIVPIEYDRIENVDNEDGVRTDGYKGYKGDKEYYFDLQGKLSSGSKTAETNDE